MSPPKLAAKTPSVPKDTTTPEVKAIGSTSKGEECQWFNLQQLHAPAAKRCHLESTVKDIAHYIGSHLWKAMQGTATILSIRDADVQKVTEERNSLKAQLEVVSALLAKEKEKGEKTSTDNLDLQARTIEIEETIAKMDMSHRQSMKEAKSMGGCYSLLSRIEIMKEYTTGKHVEWYLDETVHLFDELYPEDKDPPWCCVTCPSCGLLHTYQGNLGEEGRRYGCLHQLR